LRTRIKRLILAVLPVCMIPAQDFRASISGRVTDPSGAVIAGSKVTVINAGTSVATETQTNEQGAYTAPYLVPGPYEVRAEAPGFRTAVRGEIVLQTSDRRTLDFILEVGSAAEVVEVRGETSLVDTSAAVAGTVISSRTVTQVPTLTRIPYLMASLSPGVVARDMNGTVPNAAGNATASGIRVNGGVGDSSNEYLIDGVPNNTTSRVAFIPSADAIQEFKIVGNAYDAQYGRQAGSTINVTIRSGSNDYHGGAYHFYRDFNMSANSFQSNLSGRQKDEWRYNLWGGQLGGPVRVPRLYDGRNRTFFFFNYEGMIDLEPRFSIRSVPTAEQRAGDFSQTTAPSGSGRAPVIIYDPLTTNPTTGQRQPFPGNRIPADRISPIARNALEYISLPNLPPSPAQATGSMNYVPNIPTEDTIDSAVTRLDHQFSDRHKVFATLRWNHWEESIGDLFGNIATGQLATRINRGIGLDDVYVFGPATVLNVRYGLARWESPTVSNGLGFDPTQLGFSPALVAGLPVRSFPSFSVGGLGGTPSDYTITTNHSWIGALTRTQARHTLNAGVQVMVLQTATFNAGSGAGNFTFSPQFTQRDFQTADRLSGSDVASFLLGYPSAGQVSFNASGFYSQRYFGLYLQDDWRVTSRLTLSLGLRWDVEVPQRERFLRANRGFDPSAPNPVEAAVQAAYARNPIPELPASQFSVRGGQLFAGVDGQPARVFATDYRTWQPRAGLAFRVDSKTAIRAGFGLFTSKTIDRGGQLGFSIETPYVATVDGGRTPANSLSNPFPQGLLAPSGASLGLATSLGQQPRWDDPTRRLPFSIQSSFHVQRELPGTWLLEAGYSYNKSKRLGINVPSNQLPLNRFLELGKPRYDAAGALLAQPFRLEDRVPNPFVGLPQFAGTALGTGSTTSVLQLMSAFPQFAAFNRGLVDAGRSSYHGLQVKVEKRFSETLSFIASHTWSKQLDYTTYLTMLPNLGYQLDHSLNPDDRTHYFSTGWSWELPFGRGRRYLGGASGVANAVIGGWQLAGFYTVQSGRPVSFSAANLNWSGLDASLSRGERSLDRWFRTERFGPVPKENTYALRTAPTTFSSIRASRQNNIDLAVFKNFKVAERTTFQLRGESFNALNHPRFGDPVTNPTNAGFGTVAKSQLNQPRIIQVALKVNF
jgi:hypothetical protein